MHPLELDLSVVELRHESKQPEGEWRQWMTKRMDLDMVQDWHGNIGIVCGAISGNLIVMDFDQKEPAREWYKVHRNVLKTIVETRRGAHFYYRWDGEGAPPLCTFEYGDLKGEGSYVVAPPSTVFDPDTKTRWTYRFVSPLVSASELPVFNPEWVPKSAGKAITREVRDAIKYVMEVESIQGQHGSNALFRACAILRDAGLSESEAMVHLMDWNASGKACPPWSPRELARACSNSFRKGR